MSRFVFLRDKLLFLFVNLLLFIIVAIVMVIAKAGLQVILMVFIIWFGPLSAYIFLDMIKHKKYYDEITSVIEELEQKYLLPEVLEEPDFIQGKILDRLLKEIGRDMHENVKYYKEMQQDYREYIEMWVHEIKTPIASARLMIENHPSDTMSKIGIQLERIESFVEQVLYYSRSDEVGKDYIIKELDLSTVVKKVVKRNIRDFVNKKIKLELNEGSHIVYSDVKWTEFIINQILVNAIKYSKENNAIVSIYYEERESAIALIIEDNGVGISEQDINRVFEKGFTGENGRIFGKSTGMGLYLCKKLCEKLGLGIDIKSEEGKGTKVTLIFPYSTFNRL